MSQDTTTRRPPSSVLSPLLVELWHLLAAHRPAVGQQRVFDRLRGLVLGHLGALFRHTITQSLLGLGLEDTDPTAWYRLISRARVCTDTLARCFLRQTMRDIPADGLYPVVLDGVQLPRASRTMPGTAWLKNPRTPPWKPGSHRAQFFGHLAVLLPRWEGSSRAVPLRLDPAFPPKAVPGAAPPQTEAQVGRTQLAWLRTALDGAGRREQRILAVADTHYDTPQSWRDLPAHTILLTRTATNRALWHLPPAGSRKNRKYGERAPHPGDWLAARTGWEKTTVHVRGRDIRLR